ncbi:hypothetical protein AB6A40_003723 [Gnathostoma spinigerum]|uniref:Protein aurora borealis n=1 Tax=Gnathostoma spinigerum TaxID=75299 RepID=A0ABD6EI47_9BILA
MREEEHGEIQMTSKGDDDAIASHSVLSFETSAIIDKTENGQSSEGSSTPPHCLTNPFDSYLVESLGTTTFNSDILNSGHKSTSNVEGEESSQFRWSIGQIAILHPADIDENSVDYVAAPSPTLEAQINEAIDSFWSKQKFIAPSPDARLILPGHPTYTSSPFGKAWPSASKFTFKPGKRLQEIRESSPLLRSNIPQTPAAPPPSSRSLQQRSCETQTLLTFPPALDLVKLLGDRFQYNTEVSETLDEARSDANLSINSLRRKLFAEDVETSHSSSLTEHISSEIEVSKLSSQVFTTSEDGDSLLDDFLIVSNKENKPNDSYFLRSEDVTPPTDRSRLRTPSLSPIHFFHDPLNNSEHLSSD